MGKKQIFAKAAESLYSLFMQLKSLTEQNSKCIFFALSVSSAYLVFLTVSDRFRIVVVNVLNTRYRITLVNKTT